MLGGPCVIIVDTKLDGAEMDVQAQSKSTNVCLCETGRDGSVLYTKAYHTRVTNLKGVQLWFECFEKDGHAQHHE